MKLKKYTKNHFEAIIYDEAHHTAADSYKKVIEEFEKIRSFVYKRVGIALSEQKSVMVKGRLHKRLKHFGFKTFSEYYRFLNSKEGEDEFIDFINAISTNVTSFFRSPQQWQYLKENMEKIFGKKQKIRIWSAACSSGEEPYTISMFLRDNLKDFSQRDIKILATDISHKAMSKGVRGEYAEKDISGISSTQLQKYFDKHRTANGLQYAVKDELKSDIVFRSFNLVTGDFTIFKNKFDIIFCRNVMIYFDNPTKKALISRYAKLLDKGGLLVIGDSEAITENKHEFGLLKSSIYTKL